VQERRAQRLGIWESLTTRGAVARGDERLSFQRPCASSVEPVARASEGALRSAGATSALSMAR
jgi:hypothetical protein